MLNCKLFNCKIHPVIPSKGFIHHLEIKLHHVPGLFSLLFVFHTHTQRLLQCEECGVSLDSLGKQTEPAFGRIKAASQSEFRTACAVTRGNLFAQILSKQTQTC